MILVPLPPGRLDQLWAVIAPFAAQMAARFPDNWPVAEIRRQFIDGILALSLIWSPEEQTATGLIGTGIHQLGSQYQAAVGLTNAEAANFGNRINAAQRIDASGADQLSAQPAAAGGYTQAQSTDINNIFGASGALADLCSAGLNRALSAAQTVPGLAAAQYAPGMHLAQVGAARESDQAARQADFVARHNFQQRAPMGCAFMAECDPERGWQFQPDRCPANCDAIALV